MNWSQYVNQLIRQDMQGGGPFVVQENSGARASGIQQNTFTSAQGGRGAHARYKASKKKKKG
jgi:hypothetical protein